MILNTPETRAELALIAKRLNLPTLPVKAFTAALENVYADFIDTTYNDIHRDISAEYLTFTADCHYICNNVRFSTGRAAYGFLVYDDGDVQTIVAIN